MLLLSSSSPSTRFPRATAAAFPPLTRHSACTRRFESICLPSPRLKCSLALLCARRHPQLPPPCLTTLLRKPHARIEKPVGAVASSQMRRVPKSHTSIVGQSPNQLRGAALKHAPPPHCTSSVPASHLPPLTAPLCAARPMPPANPPVGVHARLRLATWRCQRRALSAASAARILSHRPQRRSAVSVYAVRRRQRPLRPHRSAQAHQGT
ncbi:hypothetical protein B0H15DRAFT_477358 [Mycena belliarum]|uniref:Uncharacterized protein n=1 Tax=Mycena belliarum TaxID=1033014 RepID=A0AAD6XKB3_9AGAR|nr:hypothetical protein B0H15DRAFT_477358 [Mycena belliae]